MGELGGRQPEVVICSAIPLVTSLHFSENVRFPIHHFLLFPFYRSVSPPSTLSCLFLSLSILLSVLFAISFSLPHCVALFLLYFCNFSLSLPPGVTVKMRKKFLSIEFSFTLGILFPKLSLPSCVQLGSSGHGIH